MGWDGAYHWTTKAIAVKEIVNEYKDRLLAYHSAKSGLWMVIKSAEDDQTVVLVVYLLEKHGGHWMRKGMDEQCGPFVYDCPAHLVAMVPEPANAPKHDANDPWNAKIIYPQGAIVPEHGDTWRSMWRKHHARDEQVKAAKRNLAIGDELTLTNGWNVKVTNLRPLLATDANGKTWRVPAKFLTA